MGRAAKLISGVVALAAALALTSGTAQAQDYPGTTPTTAASCSLTISASGAMLPNATVDVTLGCDAIVAGRTYTGALASTPVVLPATVAAANDAVTFRGVKLPADWAVNATHTATLSSQSGGTIGTVTFYVGSDGRITAAPKSNLPRTGSNSIAPVLRTGSALLALGGAVLLVARRRRVEAIAP